MMKKQKAGLPCKVITPKEPQAFYENLEWIKAVADWDKGYKDNLGLMIERMRPPVDFMPIISAIVSGARTSNTKGNSLAYYKPSEQIKIALELEMIVSGQKFLSGKVGLEYLENYLTDHGAKNLDPMDLHHKFDGLTEQIQKIVAKKHKITVSTIKKYSYKFNILKKSHPNFKY
jgi:hypothetical protein